MPETIFPIVPVPSISVTAQEAGSTVISAVKELAFDFGASQLILEDGNPKAVSGIEALKIWIEKAIRTARYRWPIYSFQYGSELEDIFGSSTPSAAVDSEIERVIRDALIYDNRIQDVNSFIFEADGDLLKVTFTVTTAQGAKFTQGVTI